MLVLSRKRNESIIIGDNITIVVVEIKGDKCRLGIEAPRDVSVHRNEVYEAIRRNGGQRATDDGVAYSENGVLDREDTCQDSK